MIKSQIKVATVTDCIELHFFQNCCLRLKATNHFLQGCLSSKNAVRFLIKCKSYDKVDLEKTNIRC